LGWVWGLTPSSEMTQVLGGAVNLGRGLNIKVFFGFRRRRDRGRGGTGKAQFFFGRGTKDFRKILPSFYDFLVWWGLTGQQGATPELNKFTFGCFYREYGT